MTTWNPELEIALSESDEEGDHILQNVKGRECIIFIVDANMYDRAELLESALTILRSTFLSGLMVNDKDLIGLVFINTEFSLAPFGSDWLENVFLPDNCAVFLAPRQLDTFIVEHFLKFVEVAPIEFGKIYGTNLNGRSCNFSHVLRLCMDLVQQCNHLINNTTIVFLTDNELPHPYNSEYYRQALQMATDLKHKALEFHLIPMVDDFNYNIFYREFICLLQDINIDCFEPPHPKRMREMLSNRKFKQHYVRRSLGYITFSLGTNLILSAQYFNYYKKHKKPLKLLLQRTDNAVVRKHRINEVRKYDYENESLPEIKYINIKNAWYEINLESLRLRLSYEQVNDIRNIHTPGMVLLGFKPISYIKGTLFSKTAHFMYPDEFHIEGSKRLFRALWQKCIEKRKIAICLFMCKKKSMPRYVALLPINDDIGTSKNELIMANNGFKIFYLSCNSYIRKFNLCDWNSFEHQTYEQEQMICEKLMKKFRLDYKPDIWCEPSSDHLQSKLLGLAFNVKYETLGSQYFPNPEKQNLRINSILPTFKQIFGEEVNDMQKRLLDNNSRPTNVGKKLKINSDINNKEYVMQMIKSKSLNSLSKDQLLQILNDHLNKNVSKNIRKQEILDIIYKL